jgi:hypothetical protein
MYRTVDVDERGKYRVAPKGGTVGGPRKVPGATT